MRQRDKVVLPNSRNQIQERLEQPYALLHIPHSSTHIPADLRETFLLSDNELSSEMLRMTDHFTDELFQCDADLAAPIVFPVSRLIVDPERFLNDALESMSGQGMGAIYTRTSNGRALREPPSERERASLLQRFYLPHHGELTQAVRSSLTRWGSCLIIDCHSFPSVPLPCDLDQSPERPDICLGRDAFHTPSWLVSAALQLFRGEDFSVMVNSPYKGTMVPDAFLGKTSVWSLMVEVNRSLYMDETSGERLAAFIDVATKLQRVIGLLATLTEGRIMPGPEGSGRRES